MAKIGMEIVLIWLWDLFAKSVLVFSLNKALFQILYKYSNKTSKKWNLEKQSPLGVSASSCEWSECMLRFRFPIPSYILYSEELLCLDLLNKVFPLCSNKIAKKILQNPILFNERKTACGLFLFSLADGNQYIARRLSVKSVL